MIREIVNEGGTTIPPYFCTKLILIASMVGLACAFSFSVPGTFTEKAWAWEAGGVVKEPVVEIAVVFARGVSRDFAAVIASFTGSELIRVTEGEGALMGALAIPERERGRYVDLYWALPHTSLTERAAKPEAQRRTSDTREYGELIVTFKDLSPKLIPAFEAVFGVHVEEGITHFNAYLIQGPPELMEVYASTLILSPVVGSVERNTSNKLF